MKVVHVSTLYYPFVGGLEIAVQKVAESQAKLGHEVHVLTSDQYTEGWRGAMRLNDVVVHRIASLKLRYPFLTIPFEDVEGVLKEADVVHGWGHNYYFVYKVLARAKDLGKPTATYFIGVDYLKHHYNPLMRSFGFKYQEFITKRVVRVSDLALVTNEYEGKVLEEKYGKRSVVLPHGIDDLYFKAPNMAKQFREKYKVEGRIIAYIGRIHPTKGLDLLIKAFAEVSSCEPDLVLFIAGKGDAKYIKGCMSLAEKLGVKSRVKYLGYLSEEDKIGLIDASELVVIPSRHAGESYPLAVDEVKTRGKPLVVTEYGVLPHRINNLVEGVVVNADVSSLARGIKFALANISSFRILKAPYTWSDIAMRLLTIYRALA
jgi:glycosyltransferase involved in cell wall biosynthesis